MKIKNRFNNSHEIYSIPVLY